MKNVIKGFFTQEVEPVNITYRIDGREDGRWVVRAYGRNGLQIGVAVYVNTPSEAWKVWRMLEGHSDEDLTSAGV